MNFDFFNDLSDKYLKTDFGRGVFLAGIALGVLANAENNKLEDAPLYKQINFGKMTLKELKKHFARIPELVRAYHVEYADKVISLATEAGELMFKETVKDLGVDGNFAFTVAFMGSKEYFWGNIFKKKEEK